MSGRRAAGSGALLRWRRDGQVIGWIGVADLGVVDGKRRRQKVYGKTQGEVQDRLAEILHGKAHGTLPKPGRLTVGAWLTEWLAGVSARPRTLEHYRLVVNRHLIPGIGSKPLGKLTASDVEQLMRQKRDSGLAPRTVHHIRAVLRNALKKAVRNRLVPYNVAAESDPPQVPHEEMQTLSADQVGLFLATAKGGPLEALFVLAVGLGMRQGELMGLRWSAIDLDRRVLRVTRALQWVRPAEGGAGVPTLVEPKSKKSTRALPLSAPAVEALRDHRKRQLTSDEGSLNQLGLVFVGPHGEPLNAKVVWDAFREVLVAAGLPLIRFHDLRHTCGTLLRERGVDVKVIQETLGHSSITTTLDLYGHVTPGMREFGVGAQAEILGAR